MACSLRSINAALQDLEHLENLTIVSRIHSFLDELDMDANIAMVRLKHLFKTLIQRLKNLRAFLLICSRKLCSDMHGSLGSLLLKIEDAVCRNARRIHPYCLSQDVDSFRVEVLDEIVHFTKDIESIEKKIDEWYVTLSDFSQQSSSPTTDEVVEIIDSVLENLVDIIRDDIHSIQHLVEPIAEMEEKIRFLKKFILFTTMQIVQDLPMPDLWTKIKAIVVNAAHLCHMSQLKQDDEWVRRLMEKVSVIMQMVRNIDPYIYETHIYVLTVLRWSRIPNVSPRDTHDDPIIFLMKKFLDFILLNLWEKISMDTSLAYSMKDQLQVLYEGLRFLKTILKDQPKSFDEKIKEHTSSALSHAGAVTSMLYRRGVNIDFGIPELIGSIKVIRAEIEGRVPSTSKLNFPRTNELGFVDFLIENLMEVASGKADARAQSRVQKLQEDLIFLRFFLGEIAEVRDQQEEFQTLWNRVVEVAYRVEFLIDPLVVGDIPDSFSISFGYITKDIQQIKAHASKILNGKREDIKGKGKRVTGTSIQISSQSSFPMTNDFVGFHDEVTSIIDRLTRGSKQLRIVAIVGMPGSGKTTLATKVYNDSSITHHFHVRAWCSVFQVFNKKKALLEILGHIFTKLSNKFLEMKQQDLAEELRRRLKGNRYLIFLDDMWSIEAWNSLEGSLPNDSNGSRVILTSRLRDVTPQAMLDEEPHSLRQLTNDESWELLQKKLFDGSSYPPALHELGMQIAENCKGLPLTIIIVAGLLATMEEEGWKEVLESLSSGIISSTEQCKNTLELSYQHLSDCLKPCFLYFGAFLEDQEHPVNRLIRLWIAEGFIRKDELKSLQNVAADYMMDLISRSLLMVAKQGLIGGVKTIRIHDLLHDFCLTKAKEENLFQLLQGHDELLAFNEPCYLRRLCIYSKPLHFKESQLFCPRVRSLLFFPQRTEWYEREWLDISFIIHSFKLLRVLDLRQFHIGYMFPREIKLLIQLKYLAVRGLMKFIPSSIGKLSNLETFIVVSRGLNVFLPDTLWNLQKLRHLHINTGPVHVYNFTGFRLPIENLDNSSVYVSWIDLLVLLYLLGTA